MVKSLWLWRGQPWIRIQGHRKHRRNSQTLLSFFCVAVLFILYHFYCKKWKYQFFYSKNTKIPISDNLHYSIYGRKIKWLLYFWTFLFIIDFHVNNLWSVFFMSKLLVRTQWSMIVCDILDSQRFSLCTQTSFAAIAPIFAKPSSFCWRCSMNSIFVISKNYYGIFVTPMKVHYF